MAIVTIAAVIGGVNLIFYNSEREINAIVNRPRQAKYSIALNENRATGINDRGEIVWEIESEKVTVSAREDQYEFHKATARFFDSQGPNLYIEVEKIVYDEPSQDLHLLGGVHLLTRDEMAVSTEEVHWRHYSNQFIFPKQVELRTKEGNLVSADYMHGDKNLRQLFFVGHCQIKIIELKDTKFISDRELTKTQLKLQDFKNIFISADKVYYDKELEVTVAVSSFSDKQYNVTDPRTGMPVEIDYGDEPPGQIYFRKGEIELVANHVEVHQKDSWAKCYGNVQMRINPAEIKPNDAPALRSMKKRTTLITANDIEYFWDSDYARTYGRSVVMQDDRRAGAWGVTYYGKFQDDETGQLRKVVWLDDEIFIFQGSGEWLKEDEVLKDFKNPDVEKMLFEAVKVTGDKAVLFLDSADIYGAGNVRVRQKDKIATCDEMLFDDKKKKFTCQGHVLYVNKKDESFTGEQIIFFSDSDDIEVNGKADASIRIPPKYTKKFDEVKRSLAERGAKNTSDEEAVAIAEAERAKWREENKPWEFLPGWIDDVLLPGFGKGSRPLFPEAPAEAFSADGFDWMQRLSGDEVGITPWKKDGAAPGQPGFGRSGDAEVLPEGIPLAPPQVSGLSGRDAVSEKRRELGLEDPREVPGRLPLSPPTGGEFIPPPIKESGEKSADGPLELFFKLQDDMNSRHDNSSGDSGKSGESNDIPADSGNKRDPGDAIVIEPRKDVDDK
ncbi:MAG: LPS export ABC transporter periplasmic protein LptC [bacterium]